MRYRLDVAAASVAEVVTFAGGWVYDRVMAGWGVTVLVAGAEDVRPIHILGAETLDLETALEMGAERLPPHSLAVSADLFSRDSRIRRRVSDALDRGSTEVALWGETWPAKLDHAMESVQYPLSTAAQAFKAQALAAVARPAAAVASVETFCSSMATGPSVPDLIPDRNTPPMPRQDLDRQHAHNDSAFESEPCPMDHVASSAGIALVWEAPTEDVASGSRATWKSSGPADRIRLSHLRGL